MPNPAEELLEFQCPKCEKRLKAGPTIAGRKIKCPKCSQVVRVPGVKVENGSGQPATKVATSQPVKQITGDDLWLSLDEPAIDDVQGRESAAAEVKAKKAAFIAQKHRLREKQKIEESATVEPIAPHSKRQAVEDKFRNSATPVDSNIDSEDEFTLAPLEAPKSKSKQDAASASEGQRKPSAADTSAKPSVFDDDLPDLSELESPPPARPKVAGIEDLGDLDALIPDLDDGGSEFVSALPGLLDVPDTTDHEYRILCKVCGTPQYVQMSTVGAKIKCPDCFSDFKVPPPPPGWAPKKKNKVQPSNEDMPLAATTATQQAEEQASKRTRTNAMLEKAKQEISDDDLDGLYGGDFDTAGFLRRTFGFLSDPVAVSFVIGYGIVFACVFALAQFGLNNRDSGFGRGALLIGVIGAPAIGILFGLPMLSAALALLESVANRQKRVVEWPGFDMFDNFGDLLAIAAALIGSLLPGFLLGFWLGGDGEGAGRIQIAGMMLSIFALFPVFMLSILDNGSLFQPISGSVISSLKEAAEAWGGYFLKTMIVFSLTVLLWYMLLGDGKPPLMAGLAGFIVSPLVFFTFQQLGSLADSIGEHLSFEFSNQDDEEEDDSTDIKEVVDK